MPKQPVTRRKQSLVRESHQDQQHSQKVDKLGNFQRKTDSCITVLLEKWMSKEIWGTDSCLGKELREAGFKQL